MRALFVSFLFFASAGAVCAALGDDGDKIEDSYGSVVARHSRDDGKIDILYHKNRYFYYVTFVHGVSVAERYSRDDQADLSEKEIARFLKMNAGRQLVWSRVTAAGKFERSDHGAEATVVRMKEQLALTVRSK